MLDVELFELENKFGLRNLREMKVNKTAGRGTEALRARPFSLPLQPQNNESRRDILTTLRAQPPGIETFQKSETPIQEFEMFRAWLQAQGKTKTTIKETVNYAKKYGLVLDSGDASPMMSLSPRNKQHAMTALANLAKFTGGYDLFVQIRQRSNILLHVWGPITPDKDLGRNSTFKQIDHLTLYATIAQMCPKDFAAVVHPHW